MIFKKIKELRENNELTQREIAKILKVSKSTYNRWETEDAIIPVNHFNDLCNYYNVSMDYIAGFTNIKNYDTTNNIVDKNIMGKRLLEVRKENNLSQNSLAKLLNTSHSTISAYENGKTYILTIFAYQITKMFNLSLDWLYGRTQKKNR